VHYKTYAETKYFTARKPCIIIKKTYALSIFYGKEALHYKNLRFDKKITAGKFCRKMTGRNSRAGSISKGEKMMLGHVKSATRLLECQRDHFCIKCLKKTKGE
jgi:hypothetical protein